MRTAPIHAIGAVIWLVAWVRSSRRDRAARRRGQAADTRFALVMVCLTPVWPALLAAWLVLMAGTFVDGVAGHLRKEPPLPPIGGPHGHGESR